MIASIVTAVSVAVLTWAMYVKFVRWFTVSMVTLIVWLLAWSFGSFRLSLTQALVACAVSLVVTFIYDKLIEPPSDPEAAEREILPNK